MEKEQWIDEILNSTDGLQKASAGAHLFSRIERRLRESEFVSPKTVWLAAASIAILVAVNVVLIKKSAHSKTDSPTTSIASSFDKSNQFYQ
mgnify:CR=1 FL=1